MALDRDRTGPLSNREIKGFRRNLIGVAAGIQSDALRPLSLAHDLSRRTSFNEAVLFLTDVFTNLQEDLKISKGAGIVLLEFMMTDALPLIVAQVAPLTLDPAKPYAMAPQNFLVSALQRYPHRRDEILDAVSALPDSRRAEMLRDWLAPRPSQ